MGCDQKVSTIQKVEDIVKVKEDVRKPYKKEIIWFNAMVLLVFHLGTIYGTYLIFASAKILTTLWMLSTIYASILSITIGAHRLYAHRTFKANKWIRLILMTFQTLTAQTSIWGWVMIHRQHHKYSDTDADPSNSSRGFYFAHMEWLMVYEHPDVTAKRETIDMSDLDHDAIVMFQKNYYNELFVLLSVVCPVAVPCLLWNETLWNSFFISFISRLIYSWNITALANSFAHLYGNKPFTKNMNPSENSFVAFFTVGEGWHNFHHTFPVDYRASEFGQYFNVSTTIIDYCAKKGWIYDMKCVPPELMKRQAVKKGDGTHPIYGKLNPNDILKFEN